MLTKTTYALFGCVALLGAGCASMSEPNASTNQAMVIPGGGGDGPIAGPVGYLAPGAATPTKDGACTGVLVASNAVLTTATCAKQVASSGSYGFGLGAFGGEWYAAEGYVLGPARHPEIDLAVVRLSRAASARPASIGKLAEGDEAATGRKSMLVVGYTASGVRSSTVTLANPDWDDPDQLQAIEADDCVPGGPQYALFDVAANAVLGMSRIDPQDGCYDGWGPFASADAQRDFLSSALAPDTSGGGGGAARAE